MLTALSKLEQTGMTSAKSLLRSRHVRYHPYERPTSRRVGRTGWARDADIAAPSLIPAAVSGLSAPIETPELRQPSQEVLELLRGPIVGTFDPVAAFGANYIPPPLPQPAPPSPRTVLVWQLKEEAQRSDSASAFGHIWQQMMVRMASQPLLARGLPQSEPARPTPAPAPEPATVPVLVAPEAPEPEPEPISLPEPELEPDTEQAPIPTLEPVPEPESEPELEPERELEREPESVLMPVRDEVELEMERELERELALEFEDVSIPASTPSPAAKFQPEAPSGSTKELSEEEIEAALALQALSHGVESPPSQGGNSRTESSNAVGRRVTKAPKSLKARVKTQPKPEPEPKSVSVKPPLPAGKIFDLSHLHEAELQADVAELWEDFEKFKAALPVTKRMNARKQR